MAEQALVNRVEALEKEIAALKVQVSERLDIDKLSKELVTQFSLKARDIGITG